MEKIKERKRKLEKTLRLMEGKKHLPDDLVFLLGRTAAMQLSKFGDASPELPAGGLPVSDCDNLIKPENFPVDKKHALKMASGIIELILDNRNAVPCALIEPVSLVGEALKSGEFDFDEAVEESLKGGGDMLSAWANRMQGAPAALDFLMSASIAPSLQAVVSLLKEQAGDVDNDVISQRGRCPVCGSLPYMLELRGKEGFRYAVCSFCQHDYRIRRIACPVCDISDTEKIKSFTVEEEPGFRVETCDSCRTYIKTADFRNLDRDPYPSLNDLESLALDYLAVEHGFSRASQSVWKI